MDEYGSTRLDGITNAVRRKRSQTSRRPKPESLSSLSSTPPSEDIAKASSDENTGYDGSSKRKTFNLNQCISRSSASRVDGETAFQKMEGESGILYGSGGLEDDNVTGQGPNEGVNFSSKQPDVVVHEPKFKKVKLKVGGVTRTIQTSQATSESGSSTKSVRLPEAPWPLQKQSLQDDLDDDNFPTSGKPSGLRGIPWKDFSRVGFTLKKDDHSTGTNKEQRVKSDLQKSKRESKKRDISGMFNDDDDDEDDEIRYLEKLKTSRVSGGLKDVGKESSSKHKSLSRVSKGARYESLKDFGHSKSGKDGKKNRSDGLSDDTDYEEVQPWLNSPPTLLDCYFFAFLNFSRYAMANAASGIAVHDDCKLKFLELKAKRTFRFIVFKIEEKQVIVEKLGEPAESYEDFAASLPDDECRYAVYDYDFVTVENCQKSRIFFIAWCPDTAKVRSKMIYASSKDRFKRELDGIQVELQATDPTEMGLDVFKSRAN